jgi:hypothetical protein
MTDEDQLRRALDYEIEPWTPDPAALIRGGRRMAWTRRGAAAAAALAVAGTMTGVAVAVNGVTASQPPVIDRPPPSIVKPTVPPSPACIYYLPPRPTARPTAVPTAPPTREVRKPRVVTPRPAHPRSGPHCVAVVAKPGEPGVPPRAAECLRIVAPRLTKPSTPPTNRQCRIFYARPTAPVPTSVPAGK